MPTLLTLGSFADPLNQDQGAAKLINVRAVLRRQEEQRAAIVRLVGNPGLAKVCQPTTSPCITLQTALGTVWSAHADGSIFYGVETDAPSFSGTVVVNPAYPVIRMAEDRTALVIAGHGEGYTATQSGGVVNADFRNTIDFDPTTVCVLDNATIWSGASNEIAKQSDRLYASEYLDPANVPANRWATKEARADPVIDVVTTVRNFWPFGTRSVEQWYDTGNTQDFPFTPFTNSMMDVGLAARRTLATIHGKICWVGTDRRVWVGAAQSGEAMSPAWVDILLQQVDLTTLTAYMYAQGGDEFYVLTKEGEWSIELALSTMLWTYRKSYGRPDHSGRCAIEYGGGVTYVGLDTGEICRLDMTVSTEPSGVLERTIITHWVGDQERRHVIDEVQFTSYLGPKAGTVQFDWSQDGLQTWKGYRRVAFPKPGERRAIARQLGTSRRRQLRFRYSGTVAPFSIDEIFAIGSPGS